MTQHLDSQIESARALQHERAAKVAQAVARRAAAATPKEAAEAERELLDLRIEGRVVRSDDLQRLLGERRRARRKAEEERVARRLADFDPSALSDAEIAAVMEEVRGEVRLLHAKSRVLATEVSRRQKSEANRSLLEKMSTEDRLALVGDIHAMGQG